MFASSTINVFVLADQVSRCSADGGASSDDYCRAASFNTAKGEITKTIITHPST